MTDKATDAQFAEWCERHDMPHHSRAAFDDAASLHLLGRTAAGSGISDAQIAMTARDGYDRYWNSDAHPKNDQGAWAAAGRALLAMAPATTDRLAAADVPAVDWAQPTTYLQRFGDAVQALCGGNRPSDEMLSAWLDTCADDHRLQEFCIEHGPAWAQGIAVIDAARVLADQPAEDVEHEPATTQVQEARFTVDEVHQALLDYGEYSDSAREEIISSLGKVAAPTTQAQEAAPCITIDFKQATELLEMFGGEPTEVTLITGPGHSGDGLYAYWTDIPDEGALFLGVTDDEATPPAKAPAEAGSGPKSETIEQAARDVGKWLNERPNRPLDLRHVAMLVHHAEAGSGQPATTQAKEAVAEVTHCKPDNYSANHRIRWLTQAALPVGTKLYAATTQADSAQGDEAQVLSQAARDVLAERQRQISAEGWTPEHDDEHGAGEMAQAAACYAVSSNWIRWNGPGAVWPWGWEWKPGGERRNLVKSAALAIAEIERLDRAARAAMGGRHG